MSHIFFLQPTRKKSPNWYRVQSSHTRSSLLDYTKSVSRPISSMSDCAPTTHKKVARKYRDELRPRHGMLRSREFVMKDLYTFDYNASQALATYHQVRGAYAGFFNELKIPYLVAEADSGDIGGDLSHEFHFSTPKGEDHIISCTSCSYVANEELAETGVPQSSPDTPSTQSESTASTNLRVWRGISKDRNTLVNAWYLSSTSSQSADRGESEINIHAIKALIPELDASVKDPVSLWTSKLLTADAPPSNADPSASLSPQLINLVDCRIPDSLRMAIESKSPGVPLWPASLESTSPRVSMSAVVQDRLTGQQLNLLRIKDGDACPRCTGGSLKVQKAIELGHTFHLGTRYSEPLQAVVTVPVQYLDGYGTDGGKSNEATDSGSSKVVAMQMGCHGIGISRMIGAIAETLADERGLNWPRVMAPFEAVIVPGKDLDSAALEVYDELLAKSRVSNDSENTPLDLVLDDRRVTFPWKMRDADLVGYPVIIVVGRRWETEQMCEVQCRRLQIREDVPLERLSAFVQSILVQL